MSQIDLGAWRESGPSWALVYGWQLSITAEQERTQHMAKCHLPAAGQLQSCTFGPRLGQSGELGCCFFLRSHLQGPLPPGACDSLLARNSRRVKQCFPHPQPSAPPAPWPCLAFRKVRSPIIWLIFNFSALKPGKLHPADAIPVLWTVFSQNRSRDDRIFTKKGCEIISDLTSHFLKFFFSANYSQDAMCYFLFFFFFFLVLQKGSS